MKKIRIVAAMLVYSFFFLTSLTVRAQRNHSEIFSFMKNLGWNLTPDSKFSTKAESCEDLHYYDFDSGHKYAIVAFTRTKEVKDLTLKAEYKNGETFNKNYDTRQIPGYYNLDGVAMLMFFPPENMNLGIRLVSSRLSDYCSQCHYMIFYK